MHSVSVHAAHCIAYVWVLCARAECNTAFLHMAATIWSSAQLQLHVIAHATVSTSPKNRESGMLQMWGWSSISCHIAQPEA